MCTASKTDWPKIDAMADEAIDTSDIPPLTEDFFAKAKLRVPPQPTVAVRVDEETPQWFQSQGKDAENHMAIALRLYAEAHKHHPCR